MAGDDTKSIIVTFKRKDKRADKKKDKVEIVRAAIDRSVAFFDASAVTPTAMRGLEPVEIGFDVNQYEAPIVTLQVTAKEAAALRKDPNVASVEDDGLMYALPVGYDTGSLLFENQPIVQEETVPVGVNQIKAPLAWDATRGRQGCGAGHGHRLQPSRPRPELPGRRELRAGRDDRNGP
jgi:subtilisin